MMRKMFLAGAAVLSMMTTAHADGLPLTDPLVGHWCQVKDGVYKRGEWTCKGNLVITQSNYVNGDSTCKFRNVTRLRNGGYLINSICVGDIDDKVELRIVGDTLRLREFDTYVTGCAVVSDNMSDGFLNLRTGPGTTHAVKARLVTGDTLKVDGDESENGRWIKVSVPRLDGIKGWVHSDHIKTDDCLDEKTRS